jgi:DNA gyrase subunit A
MRIVLDLKKDAIADVVINQLYKMTPLQKSFGIILLSIVNNKPEVLNLKQILEYFLLHRRTIVYRRTAYDLKKAEEKAHILEGLKIAITNLDEVVALIRGSANSQEAKAGLIEKFGLSEIQAQSILEMRLHRLTGLEREKIISEYNAIIEQIAWFKKILGDESIVMNIIREEFLEIIEQYGDERRTEIIEAPDEILPEDMIQQEDMVVTVTHDGYIKRNPVDLYRSQRRGGKGIKGTTTVEEDFVSNMYLASTHDAFLFFTNYGKVFWRKVYEIPVASRIARGKAIVNLLQLQEGEKVATILPIETFDVPEGEERYIMMATKKGVVKKTDLEQFRRPMRRGKIALTIREDDEILGAVLTNGNNHVIFVTHEGMAIRFNEQNVRAMGRTAAGVRGINLAAGDEVVSIDVVYEDKSLLVVTENGYGKRTNVDEYRLIKRGGKGVFAIKASERNGKVVSAMQVVDEDELMMITNAGKIIRIKMDQLRVIGRNTQGVRLFNLGKDEKVVAVDRLAESMDDEDEVDGSEGETTGQSEE